MRTTRVEDRRESRGEDFQDTWSLSIHSSRAKNVLCQPLVYLSALWYASSVLFFLFSLLSFFLSYSIDVCTTPLREVNCSERTMNSFLYRMAKEGEANGTDFFIFFAHRRRQGCCCCCSAYLIVIISYRRRISSIVVSAFALFVLLQKTKKRNARKEKDERGERTRHRRSMG